MGIYVNPDNKEFERALRQDVYIDKTELIHHTNHQLGQYDRFMCVSRPRRFGKSMAADMLTAYYSKGCDSSALFAGKKIEKDDSYKENLNSHNVIRLDMQRFIRKRDKDKDYSFIDRIEEFTSKELVKAFSHCEGLTDHLHLDELLDSIHCQTGESFIFIVDEWDSVFRLCKEDGQLQSLYLDFLRGLFKGSAYTDLVYMTGILPIKKYGDHSALNIFEEYTIAEPKGLACYFGFTEDEVRLECQRHATDFAEMQDWYDGYLIDGEHIYNPRSVIGALKHKEFQSFWTGSETYEALKIYIDMDFEGLKQAIIDMLGGGKVRINTRHFQNDMTNLKTKDDVLTLLVHLGYLTYDTRSGQVSIPNREISEEFLNALDGRDWQGVFRALEQSLSLLEYIWNMDEEAVASTIDEIHSETTSIIQYNNENSLSCVVTMAYYSACAYYYKPIREMPAGKGFADIAYLPRPNVDHPALLIELKWDKSANGAISQIKERQYASSLKNYTGNILLIGLSYDRGSKKHQCVIEEYKMH